MQKIMIIDKDVNFVSRFKILFSDFEIYPYYSSSMFYANMNTNKKILEKKINTTDIFLLDVDISKEENIFDSGIYEIIACYKKSRAKIFSISEYSQEEVYTIMSKIKFYEHMNYDMFIGKILENVVQAIKSNSRIVLN